MWKPDSREWNSPGKGGASGTRTRYCATLPLGKTVFCTDNRRTDTLHEDNEFFPNVRSLPGKPVLLMQALAN